MVHQHSSHEFLENLAIKAVWINDPPPYGQDSNWSSADGILSRVLKEFSSRFIRDPIQQSELLVETELDEPDLSEEQQLAWQTYLTRNITCKFCMRKKFEIKMQYQRKDYKLYLPSKASLIQSKGTALSVSLERRNKISGWTQILWIIEKSSNMWFWLPFFPTNSTCSSGWTLLSNREKMKFE